MIHTAWRKAGIRGRKPAATTESQTQELCTAASCGSTFTKEEPDSSDYDQFKPTINGKTVLPERAAGGESTETDESSTGVHDGLKRSLWRRTKVHEWTLEYNIGQSRLYGRNGSTACTVISAEII